MKKALFSLCLCLLMLLACSPQQVVRPPEFIKVQDVELLELTENAATVRVRILFRNINPMGCTVEDITFSTFIDGQPLGASRIQETVSMNANEQFELILDTRLLLESVPRVLLSVFSKPEVEVEVKNGLKNLIRLKLFSDRKSGTAS